jgi:putative endonuclease
MKEKSFFWIYILTLNNGNYYTGYCKDLVHRYRQHLRGRGAKITRSFQPVNIAACWKLYAGRGAALRVEAWIKSRSHNAKQQLVEDPESLGRMIEPAYGERLRLVCWDPGEALREVKKRTTV